LLKIVSRLRFVFNHFFEVFEDTFGGLAGFGAGRGVLVKPAFIGLLWLFVPVFLLSLISNVG